MTGDQVCLSYHSVAACDYRRGLARCHLQRHGMPVVDIVVVEREFHEWLAIAPPEPAVVTGTDHDHAEAAINLAASRRRNAMTSECHERPCTELLWIACWRVQALRSYIDESGGAMHGE